LKLEFTKPPGAVGNPKELLILKPIPMKKTKFTEAQIVKVLKQHEAGSKVSDLCRELGISDATFYNWKAKYGGMEVSDVKRMKALEEENSRLKKMYAELSLLHHAFKDAVEKKL
jgi:putative transposase